MNLAFEMLVADRLYRAMMRKGKSQKEAKKSLSKILSHDRQGGLSGFHKVMHLGLKEVEGRSLQDEPALWERFARARTVRKNVIHPPTTKLKQKVCLETMKDIIRIIKWVDEEPLPDVISTKSH